MTRINALTPVQTAIAIAGSFLAAWPASAFQPPRNSSMEAEAQIAGCIRASASGDRRIETILFGIRAQESGWIGAELRNTDGSHDLGPMQINSSWIPKLSRLTGMAAAPLRQKLKNDPCFNVQWSHWIYRQELSRLGDYWKAVGAYHSPTPWRAQRYAQLVWQKITGRTTASREFTNRQTVTTVAPAQTATVTWLGFGRARIAGQPDQIINSTQPAETPEAENRVKLTELPQSLAPQLKPIDIATLTNNNTPADTDNDDLDPIVKSGTDLGSTNRARVTG